MRLVKEKNVLPTINGGTINMTSLRPGDWLWSSGALTDCWMVVLQNSAVLQRIEILWHDGVAESYNHGTVCSDRLGYIYMGRGKKRKWVERLPKWLRKHFCPYSKP